MKRICAICLFGIIILSACSNNHNGGLLDPDCTAEKAAKSAAMKATVGVGGRCTPVETAKDTGKRVVQ